MFLKLILRLLLIQGWRTIGTDRPQELVESGKGNVMLLLTKAGGHGEWRTMLYTPTQSNSNLCFIANTFSSTSVGWPLGMNPAANSWKWMSNSVRDFAEAVDESMKSD